VKILLYARGRGKETVIRIRDGKRMKSVYIDFKLCTIQVYFVGLIHSKFAGKPSMERVN